MKGNPIGVGLYSLAGVYGKKDLGEMKKMLLYAVSEGVDYFDMADQYGDAEKFFGDTMRRYRKDIQIATKLGINDKGIMDCSYNNVQKACRRSLKELNTDYIDVYQIHFDDSHTPIQETVEALEDLKKQGLIVSYGLGHIPLDRVKEYVKLGKPETLMIEFSPIKTNRYLECIDICKESNIKLATMGSTGRGILTGKLGKYKKFEKGDIRNIDPQFRRGLLTSAFRVLQQIKEIAKAYSKTPVQVAINWIANKERIYKVLVGPSTVDHLKENLGGKGWNMDNEHIGVLDRFIEQENSKLEKVVMEDIECILNETEDKSIDVIIADLIYVLDGLIEYGKFDNHLLMPMYRRIMGLRKIQDNYKVEAENIKRELREYV